MKRATEPVYFRAETWQLAAIKEAAERAELSMSEFLRRAAVDYAGRVLGTAGAEHSPNA